MGFLIAEALLVAILLDRLRMILAVLPLITGMGISPLLLAIPYDLGVERVGADLVPMIVSAALPLTFGLATNELLRMERGRLENLLAIKAKSVTHQAAPNRMENRPFCPETPLSLNLTKKITAYRNSYRVFYRVPAHDAAVRQTGRTDALLHRSGHFVSYATGALTFKEHGRPVIDLDLPDEWDRAATQACRNYLSDP